MNPTIRPLAADEARALAAARLVAVEYAPYFAHALFTVRPLAAVGLGTFAVDRHWRLYIDPATLAEEGPLASGAILLHEVGHLIRDHAGRADALPGTVDHERWNYATDAAINDDLIEAGAPLPDWVVTPAALGLEPGGIEEAYYAAITATPPPPGVGSPASGDGQGEGEPTTGGGCGSGAGDPRPSWEPSPDDPAAPGLDSGQVTITRRKIAQDVREFGGSGRGTVPAGIARWANEELDEPTVPWQKVFAGMLRRTAALIAGRLTYSYTRPGRRRLPRIVTPSMRAPRITAAAVIDTSGSMGKGDLDVALSELKGVIKAVRGTVTVLACDAAATDPQHVRKVSDVELVGGGGTDMRIGIAAAEALNPPPAVILVVTDGYTPWPATPTRARLIVLLTREGAMSQVPIWARTLYVPAA